MVICKPSSWYFLYWYTAVEVEIMPYKPQICWCINSVWFKYLHKVKYSHVVMHMMNSVMVVMVCV